MQTSTQVADTSVQNIKTTDTTKTGYPIRNVEWNKDGILGYYGELLEDGRWRAFMWDKDGKSGNPKYDLDTLPDATPTRWLCRLGPWQKQFEEHEIAEVVDWAQQKTGYWSYWGDDEFNDHTRILENWVLDKRPISGELFGRILRLDPLPLKSPRKPLKLPRFYPVLDKQRWTDVEVSPIVEDSNGDASDCVWEQTPDYWSVFVRLEYGGRDCVADMPTEKQAKDLAAVIQSAATWFVPAK